MGIFRHRPMAATLAIFSALSFLLAALAVSGFWFAHPVITWVLLIAVLLSVLVCVALGIVLALRRRERRRRYFTFAFLSVLLLFGLLRVGGYFFHSARVQSLMGEELSATVTVEDRDVSTAGYTRYTVWVESVKSWGSSEVLSGFRGALVIESAAEYRSGDRLSAVVEAVDLSELYDEPAYAWADGCIVGFLPVQSDLENAGNEEETAESEEMETPSSVTLLCRAEEADTIPLVRLLASSRSLQKSLSFRLTEGLSEETGQLAAAMLLGDRETLDGGISRDFSRAGLSHLLALSGLHMTVLIGGFAWLLRKLTLPRRIVSLLTILAVFGFLLLTGFSMSACRAGVMLTFAAFLGFFSRRPEPVTSLFLAVGLLILVLPSAVLSVGLWLSFSSVLGLLLFTGPLNTFLEKRLPKDEEKGLRGYLRLLLSRCVRFLFGAAGVTLIASFAVLPLLYLAGIDFSLFGVLGNLVTVPLMPCFLFVLLLYLVLSPLRVFGTLAAMISEGIGGWTLSVAGLLSDIPNGTVSLAYPFAGVTVAVFLIPTVLMLVIPFDVWRDFTVKLRRKGAHRPVRRKNRSLKLPARWFLVPVLLSVGLYALCFFCRSAYMAYAAPLPATVVSVTEGEMLVLERSGTGVLFDLSNGMTSGYRAAIAAGRERGITEWSAVVLTHYHARQSPSLSRLCRSERVETVYLPEPVNDTERSVMLTLADRLEALEIEYRFYTRGNVLPLEEWHVTVSEPVYIERSVQPVFYMTLEADGESLLYMTRAVEETTLFSEAAERAKNSTYLLYGSDGPSRRAVYRVPMESEELRAVLTYGKNNSLYLSPISRRTLEGGEGVIWLCDNETADLWRLSSPRRENTTASEETTK